MKQKFRTCVEKMKSISSLASIGSLLAWDQEAKMPELGSQARAEQSAALASVIHEKFIDPEMGELLRELTSSSDSLTPAERAVIRERLRDYEKSITLPPDLVHEMARVGSLSQAAWIKARKKSDYSSFAPWLERTLELKHRQAEAYGYKKNPYDPLIDDYEPGMTSADLDPIMKELREGLVPIAAAIRESREDIDGSILMHHYPTEKQKALCQEVMKVIGVDEKASRLDQSAHPFCAGISSPLDVRITTRYDEHYLPMALYSVLHESGHCLYEQGIDPDHAGTPLGESVSLGIHESQSRLWENIIGRSRSFTTFLFPILKEHFAQALKGVSIEEYYRAINIVKPSFIRVEADEVTYNLHIILRYELEEALMNREVQVDDLPAIWNEKMESYLGIRPNNDAEGVLQDMHWARGLFGYFPTYLLGNLYASQFWHGLVTDIPHAEQEIAKGEFKPILEWLRKKIHRMGRRYHAKELIKRATGSRPSASFFLDYLRMKYGEIHNITW